MSAFSKNGKVNAALTGLFMLGLAGMTLLFAISRDLPSLSQLEDYKPKLASKVYSADMKVIHEYFEQKRSYIPLEEIPEDLIQAVIATEDRKFYDHWGVDIKRFFQAAFVNLINMSYKQGASTLTQQLARQLYLTMEKTLTRKIKEIITTIRIERTYTKEEILEMYLNQMNFGHGAYGVQSAALKYFGKDVREITVDEAAMLVGLLKAPSHYTSFNHPNKARTRRNVVLNAMRELKYLTEDEYSDYSKKPIAVLKTSFNPSGIAPYFTEYVRQKLQKKYGYALYTAGLSIYTSLDSRAQVYAEKAVANQLPILQRAVNVKVPVQVALVSIDPGNGHILAFVGGRDFSESKFDRVVQARRQPGSAFKPFVYTVVIDNGYSPTYEVLNQPVVVYQPDGTRWSPQNYDLSVGGLVTLREGLRKSLNLVSVRVLQNVIQKPSLVVEYAQKMGIKSPLQAVDAISLGASAVTPLEITSAYGVFANGGVLVEPVAILRVEDKNGNVVEENIPRREEVLRKETAYIMADMLRSVIDSGTGASARRKYHFYRPAGGKTGTTNNFSDAWFIGFTPQIVTGVWVGVDDYKVSLGNGQSGSRAALPIWARYMKAVHDTLALPKLDFKMPEGVTHVTICLNTKLLANDICPNPGEEVFFSALAPTRYCEEHLRLKRRDLTNHSKSRKRIRF